MIKLRIFVKCINFECILMINVHLLNPMLKFILQILVPCSLEATKPLTVSVYIHVYFKFATKEIGIVSFKDFCGRKIV